MEPIIRSMLDTDLYKLTMQNAVCKLYPRAFVQYTFINRGTLIEDPTGEFITLLKEQIKAMDNLALTGD